MSKLGLSFAVPKRGLETMLNSHYLDLLCVKANVYFTVNRWVIEPSAALLPVKLLGGIRRDSSDFVKLRTKT
jgi:hypothetical protein